jgi:RNA polymerase sigma-54 factor
MDLSQVQTQRQVVSPRLIEANFILSLSLTELEETVQTELRSNPALEIEEHPACPRCGATLEGAYCSTCRLDSRLSTPETPADDYGERYSPTVAVGQSDDDFDPMTLIASEIPLVDRILSDLVTLIEPCDKPVAEYIVNSLDDRGYLEVSVDHIAQRCRRSVDDVERILRAVQQVAPVGVAARDVRECLLLQLAYLAQGSDQTIPAPVWRIVADHLDDLAAHRYSLIARRLSLTTAEVGAAHEFIRTMLNPFPLQNQEARWWKTPTRAPYAVPDAILYYRDDEFQIEIVQSRATRLRLDPLYASLAADISAGRHQYANEDRDHIRQHVMRAKMFISNINQRYETLRKITECLLDLQRDFVLSGVRALKPLTRGMVAERVGVHESTVSRATANKYLMLPNREVIPYSTFFVASLSTKDVIKEIISGERRALTDKEICDRLRQQGIRIARRTVAKYRATIGIPASMLRSSATAS